MISYYFDRQIKLAEAILGFPTRNFIGICENSRCLGDAVAIAGQSLLLLCFQTRI